MPRVSVIVPCHNSSKYLKDCLNHLITQIETIPDIEIILVDDASNDNGMTRAILCEYERLYPQNIMIVCLDKNLRQGGARNVGIKYSSGEYIAFCDSDDWIVTGALRYLYDIATDMNADIVEFDITNVYDNAKSNLEKEVEKICRNNTVDVSNVIEIRSFDERKNFLFNKISNEGHCNKLYRGDLIRHNDIQYPMHVTMEEPAFTIMVKFLETKHVRINVPLYFYHLHEDSTLNSDYNSKKFDNAITHLFLYDRLCEKGLLDQFRLEIEYLFWYWYYLNTLLFAVHRNCFFSKEEYLLLQTNTINRVHDIGNNPYFMKNWGILPELATITYTDVDALGGMEMVKTIFTKLNSLC